MFKDLLRAFARWWFPAACPGCSRTLMIHEHYICLHCHYHLPITNFHRDPKNASVQRLWGKVPVEGATSFLYFRPDTLVKNLLIKIKYKNHPHLAQYLGKYYATIVESHPLYSQVDLILPIPLHAKRFAKRGYNQSWYIAKGWSTHLNIPIEKKCLLRRSASISQTKVRKNERFENVKDAFHLKNQKLLENKHVLIIDDVLTTGSTLESSIQTLLSVEGIRISVLTLARAH